MKKELILPIAILGLTITFGVICFLVYITGGIPSLIKKKMKIGALLLTFNAMVWGVSAQDDIDNPLSCYVQSSSAIYLGPNAGYNKTLCTNFPDNSIELSPKDINPNNIKQNLSGNGYFFGLSYYQFLGPKTGTKHAIILNLNYQKSSGNKDQILNDTSFINHWPHNTTVTKFIYHNEFSLSTCYFSQTSRSIANKIQYSINVNKNIIPIFKTIKCC